MANVVFNKVIAKDGKTAKQRYDEMVKLDGVFYLVDTDLYLKDVLLSADIASEIGVTDVAAHFEGSTVEEVLAELAVAADDKKIWFTDDSGGQSDYAKVYKLWQGANSPSDVVDPATLIGTINIPKDKVIQSGSIVVIFFDDTDDTLHEGSISGPDVTELIVGPGGTATEADAGKYLKLVLQNVTDAVYISVKDFGGAYTGGTTPEATVLIDGSNVITVTINKVSAEKVIYQAAVPEEYIQVEVGDTFDDEVQYYIYDDITETYVVDPTVDASNFDDKVAAGLYTKTEAIPEVTIKSKVDVIDAKEEALEDYVGTIPIGSEAHTVVEYVDEKAGAGVDSLNGEAAIASKTGKAVTLKGGVVEVEGIISNSPTAAHLLTEHGYYEDGTFYVEEQIDGYLNTSDGKFYEEDTFVTEIIGETGKVYLDLLTDVSYIWDDVNTEFVEGERTEIVPVTTKTYVDRVSSQKYNWTGHAYIEVASDIVLADVSTTGAAEDVTIADEGNLFTATNVEDALAELAIGREWIDV